MPLFTRLIVTCFTMLVAAAKFVDTLAPEDRVALWTATAYPGVEHLELNHRPDAIEVDGLVLAYVDGEALRLAYRLRCDPDWTTRGLLVLRALAAGTQLNARMTCSVPSRRLSSSSTGSWLTSNT